MPMVWPGTVEMVAESGGATRSALHESAVSVVPSGAQHAACR